MFIAASTNDILVWVAAGGVTLGVGALVVARVLARTTAGAPDRATAPSAPPTRVAEEHPTTVIDDVTTEDVSTEDVSTEDVPAESAQMVDIPVTDEPVPDTPVIDEPVPDDTVVDVPSVRERTTRTRGLFASAFASIRGRGRIDSETWDDLEEMLLRADLGVGLVSRLLEELRAQAAESRLAGVDDLIGALRATMTAQLSGADRSLVGRASSGPAVWLFVGVNGVGKTTTIGKVATSRVAEGATVLLAAGDTFRAAAAEQLQVWAERSGASFVRGAEGADPASVVFDGIESAAAKNVDLVLADTAGRLQNKTNLMEELRKVRRVADKAKGTVTEVLLVIDATTGQNGLSQAREFAAATDVTGVVLTKLDGSAKGGIVFAIETELGIPVKLVGLGEGAHDLVTFNPSEFVSALFE